MPPVKALGVSMLGCSDSTLIMPRTGEPVEAPVTLPDSGYAVISFPVLAFHTCIVPSHEATRAVFDSMHMEFTT
jgi:hypothetical protein